MTIATLSDGEIRPLHVGLEGTMNALFRKDLADKTYRGQIRRRIGSCRTSRSFAASTMR